MTSLNTTTGWDANKLTGSNLTHGVKQGSGAVAGKQAYPRNLPKEEEKEEEEASGARRAHARRQQRATPATSVSSSSSSTPTTSSSLLTTGGGGGSGVLGPDPSNPLSETVDDMRQRELFYKEKYDYMTGVRIASTLGGFFLLVLLTLLYKSKCKGKHSREPSTLTLNTIPYPAPIHPAHLTLMRGQNIQVNGRHHNNHHHHHHDFGGGGSPGGGGLPPAITLLDTSGYGCMNQVHPAISHQPVFSNCYSGTSGRVESHMRSPAVLLITAANSESSDEELSELISGRDVVIGGRGGAGGGGPEEPPPQTDHRRRTRNVLGPVPPGRQVIGDHHLHPRSKSPPTMLVAGVPGGDKGNIDINVILPTPSISPSGSENFNVGGGGQYFGGGALFPSIREGGGVVVGGNRARLLVSRSLSSDNENEQSDTSGGGGEASECSSSGGGGDAAAAMALAFGCANSSLFSLDNLKYVDDTSSENIPTRASDADDADDREDTRSIGSDSVFACFDHNFDHIAPTYARRVSSVSGTSSGVLVSPYPGASPLPRHHHLYHYSIHPPPPPPLPPFPPATPPPTTTTHQPVVSLPDAGAEAAGATSSSGFCEGTAQETSDFRVTLTQAHAQVHHRDSFCSDLESVNDYMETGARRRSSSTQTTLSDLRQALGYSPVMLGWSNGGATSPGTISLTSTHHSADISNRRLSVPRRRRSLSPHVGPPCAHLALSPRNSTASTSPPYLSVTLHPAPQPPTSLPLPSRTTTTTTANASTATTTPEGGPEDTSPQVPLTPATPTNPPPPTVVLSPSSPFIPPRVMRKRSFDAVRKTLSLQCEDKGDMVYVSSSNDTTPTN